MCCDCLDGGRYIVTGQSGSQAAAVVSGDCENGEIMCNEIGVDVFEEEERKCSKYGEGRFVVTGRVM